MLIIVGYNGVGRQNSTTMTASVAVLGLCIGLDSRSH